MINSSNSNNKDISICVIYSVILNGNNCLVLT